jgi:hypothetical protein
MLYLFLNLYIAFLGIWVFIDVFFIGSRIGKKNEELERQIILNVKAMNSSTRGA